MKKRLFSILLALTLCLSLLPTAALADTTDVAEVNGTGYATLQAAVDAAPNNATIKILRDIVIEIPADKLNKRYCYCTIDGKTLTLDLNGKTISWCDAAAGQTGDEYDVVFWLKNGANVTLTGNGTIDGRGVGSMCSSVVWLVDKTQNRLTIKNGTFYSQLIIFIFTGCGEVLIEGGYYSDPAYDGHCQIFNVTGYLAFADETKVTMTGGTLDCRDPRYLNDGNAVADGYVVRKVTKADGKRDYTVIPESEAVGYYSANTADCDYNHPNHTNSSNGWKAKYGEAFPTTTRYAGTKEDAVAKIGDTYYLTLQAAVDAAATGDTVKVIKDIEVDPAQVLDWNTRSGITGWGEAHPYCIISGKKITLDLDGHKISYKQDTYMPDLSKAYGGNKQTNFFMFLLLDNADLTITGNGTIDASINGHSESEALSSHTFRLHNDAKARLTIENGSFFTNLPNGDKSDSNLIFVQSNGGEVTINDGTFEVKNDQNRVLNVKGTSQAAERKITVYGGTVVNQDVRATNDGNMVAADHCAKVSTRDDGAKLYTVAKHDASRTSAVTTEPTYSSEGVRTYYCAHCGAEVATEAVSKLSPVVSLPVNSVSTFNALNGAVSVNHDTARQGSIVTVTVDPANGSALDALSVVDANGNAVAVTHVGGNKYSFVMPATDVTVRASFTSGTATGFVDVPADKYFYNAVNWAVANGITSGTDATHFSPYASCTRGQLVTFLWRAAGCPAAKATENAFGDVKETSSFYKAILWAAENGIVTGYNDGTFQPNASVTRQQTAAILYRYAKFAGMDVSVGEDTNILSFNDAFSVSEYAVSAFQWATGAQVITGNGANLLPYDTCTRAQIVTMLYRLLAK